MYKQVIVSEEHYKLLKKNARLCKKTIRDYFNDEMTKYLENINEKRRKDFEKSISNKSIIYIGTPNSIELNYEMKKEFKNDKRS